MARVISTDSLSLLTQNNLNKSQSSPSSAIEHLSSGLHINSTKDDAAGQAVANRFTVNIKGLTQASRNTNDGISVAQTAKGTLNEVSNNLQRIRGLTVQTANGTSSNGDLFSIQAEITQRLREIDCVSEQTQFNGVEVLAESNEMKIQVDADDEETITTDLTEIDTKVLGLDGFNIDGAQKTTGSDLISKFKAAGADNYQINGTDNYTVNVDGGAVQNEDGDAISVSAADSSLTTKSGTEVGGTGINAIGLVKTAVSLARDASIKCQNITFTDEGTGTFDDSGNGTLTANTGGKDVTSIIASSAGTTEKDATLTTSDPVYKNSAGQFVTTEVENKATTASDLDLNNARKVGSSLVVNGADYEVGTDGKTVTGLDKIMYLSKSEGDSPILVNEDAAESLQSATNPLKTIDKALTKVDSLRSDLGAVQNYFGSATTNLGNTINNLSSARDRIEDAGYATEMSNISRAQILR